MGGTQHEKDAVRTIKDMHKGEEGWPAKIKLMIPRGAQDRSRDSTAVFMMNKGAGHPEEGDRASSRTGKSARKQGTPSRGKSTTPTEQRPA